MVARTTAASRAGERAALEAASTADHKVAVALTVMEAASRAGERAVLLLTVTSSLKSDSPGPNPKERPQEQTP